MGINIGLDIGAISLKLAALGKPGDRRILESLCAAHPEFRLTEFDGRPLVLSDYRRIAGSPIQSTYDLLHEFYETVPEDRVEGIRVTGSGSRTIAKVLGLFFENEFKAIARMIGAFYPQVRTVFEIGGESSKYIRLDGGSIVDYDRSGECAAGTGSFLDQQALRMQYSVEEVGAVVCDGQLRRAHRRPLLGIRQERHDPRPAEGLLAGRDSARPVRRGGAQFQELHRQGPAGGSAGGADRRGLAECRRHRRAARGLLAVRERPARAASSTPGAAPSAPPCWRPKSRASAPSWRFTACASTIPKRRVQDTQPLSTENVVQLRDRVGVYVPPPGGEPIPAYLGLDIGSVSTNVVAIDEFGAVIHDVYLRTAGRPIEAVQQGLAEVRTAVGQPPARSAAWAPPARAAS